MFRSLSSKNSASSSKRNKTVQSSRRTESVASSSTHRKHSRNDERTSKNDRKPTSTQPPVDGSSSLSTYYTTSDRLDQLEPRSLTEEAIRSLGMQDDEWRDTYSHADDLPSGPGHADKRERFGHKYKNDTGRRSDEDLDYHSPTGETMPDERLVPRGEYAQNSFGTSSRVQDQFPGQDPSTFARSAFTSATTQGVVAGGAAAEYYSQVSMQPHETGSQNMPSQAFAASHKTSNRPTGQFEPLMSNGSAYPNNSYTTAPADVPYNDNAANQNYTYSQPQGPTEHLLQGHTSSYGVQHQHPQSVPSATAYTDTSYTTPVPSQVQGHGKHASTGQNLAHVAAAEAAVADAHSQHHHTMHQYTHSAPNGHDNSHDETHGYSPPRPYTSGAMAMQHKHKGSISKFVDWWKDYEDVRKMEEYTEYIGVCKYCFDPRSTATDAPRKHNSGGRRSSDSLRRRSRESLRRTHTNGSDYGRVDKDARYHSSDSERRSKRTSWLGAGVAAYGLSKVGKSLWQNSRDFDDTYSVKSGRKSEVSRNGSRRGKNYSSGLDSRSERTEDRRGEHDSFDERLKAGMYNLYRPENLSSDVRVTEDGRYGTAKSGSATAGGSQHTEDQIHVRHPSPGAGHISRHAAYRKGYKSRSRSQSPSLAQILGLTSSHRRTSAKASRSSSLQQDSMFTNFLSKPSNRSKPKQSTKKGFFNFANSSSSSSNPDLAFGVWPTNNGKSTKKLPRKSSDEYLKATLLGIGATAAALSAVQRSRLTSKKADTSRLRNRDHLHATQRSKQNSGEEDGWESATDHESGSSGLAFGDFESGIRRPRRQRSSESITSQSSGTDKWSWRWRREADKREVTKDVSQTNRSHIGRDLSLATSQPLRYMAPAPISSPMHSDVRGSPSMPGVYPEQSYNVNGTPIQQPQPMMPLRSSIFGTQTPPDTSHNDQYSPRVSACPTIPTELRRTQSSPVSNNTMRNAAIAGIAGAAAAGILANGKGRTRDDSPSNVRFELTEKQAKKEERQYRKDNAKESKDQAKEGARAKKERARLDRERAMQEDSVRKATEDARHYAEEAERQRYIAEQTQQQQTRMREAAAAEALVREAYRRRREETREFMQNALAEQACEAEQKKQREAWQAQQMAGARQENVSTSMPYATRSYEPSNEHSGQPLMDDDLIDPEFFTRRRSHSDLARHEELAKKAAAKIVADLEDKYRSPAPSQAEFFAPRELFEPSKGKTKVHGPIDDNDFQVYHMSEDQLASMPSEPPPPYQPSYQFANMRDKKGPAPWDIPKLNVIAPTPPASYAGSAKDDKSPISASERITREANEKSIADVELQKSSKISWGEDQTRFYEITTPESSQEHVVLPDGLPQKVSVQAKAQHSPTSHTSNLDMDGADHLIEEITRQPPCASAERFYQQPFVESVDDIAFTMDSPGTEGAPPVQGFVEGEIDDATEQDDQMPHIPGGFDDMTPEPQSEDMLDSAVQNLRRQIMQEQQSPPIIEQDQDDYFMTKKQRRRRDKEARRASLVEDQRSPVDNQSDSSRMHQPRSSSEERDVVPGAYVSTPGSEPLQNRKHNEQSSRYEEVDALIGAAAAVGALVHNARSRSPTRRKSEPEDFDRQRAHSSHSEPRDTVSQSTPTSPVYERRPSLPSHAFDDLDMLPGSKKPKKSKRNSLLNYPAIGSPLRSAMTWDDHIELMDVREYDQSAQTQSNNADYDNGHSLDDTEVELRRNLTSPESERGAASIVSAPAGDEDSGRRRKHRKPHREREKSASPRRSISVAASEPYESSRKHKRRSHRDDADLDDASSIRSRSSHSSRRDEEEGKGKKKGGILSLFRRKTSDDVVGSEQKRANGDEERSKYHRRRHSSEHANGEFAKRRDSPSRSNSYVERDDAFSRHSSSPRHRRKNHRDESVDDVDVASQTSESRRHHKHRSRDQSQSPEKEFDDTRSQTSESRRKHRHRERDLDLDVRRSLSRDSKTTKDEDKSFLVDRVEDEESVPLPEDDSLSSSQASESIEHLQGFIASPVHDKMETTEQVDDSTLSPMVTDEPVDFMEGTVPEDPDVPTQGVEARSDSLPSEALSPPSKHMTPARPIVPLRISSSTAVPLRFRRPPTSPSLPKERSASFSSSIAQSPSSPITPKAKRPLSSELMHSTEFRPLYLLERTRKPQTQESEQDLPSLPPSRSTSSSSLQSSEDWQSAAEDFDPSEHDNLSPPNYDQSQTEEPEDVLGSAQTTPKATEFPKHILDHRPHLEPEYYSWSDMEREEHLRQENERDRHNDLVEEQTATGDEVRSGIISDDAIVESHMDPEVVVNQDPMTTDVWGELSDEELSRTKAGVREEPEKPVLQLQEPEFEASFISPAKKRKNKKAAKLGTSSVSTLTSPIRETPAELARRREKDAQDAVDTWFQPVDGSREAAVVDEVDASLVPLPESSTPTEANSIESESLPAPIQENEALRQELESTSPLLSRKKSKKGKKKQKSVVLDEPSSGFTSIENPSEAQMDSEIAPETQSPMGILPENGERESQTGTPPDPTAHEHRLNTEDSKTNVSIDIPDEVPTLVGPEQSQYDKQLEEPDYTTSKAERKKQKKKAKKAALSIAVPAVAAAVLAVSDHEGPEQGDRSPAAGHESTFVDDRKDERPIEGSVDDYASSVPGTADDHPREVTLSEEAPKRAVSTVEAERFEEPGAIEQQDAADEPIELSEPIKELSLEEISLPDETRDELDELVAKNPVSESSVESTPQEQAQRVPEDALEQRPPSSGKTNQEATSKRSSWFSWLPGSKTQEADEPKIESRAIVDFQKESDVLNQEPFERLLEQPTQHPEIVDEPNI
ncbi:hypothetical protein M436DRAFT_10614, partial [Aureobasidium namibiae CBS 147.97]